MIYLYIPFSHICFQHVTKVRWKQPSSCRGKKQLSGIFFFLKCSLLWVSLKTMNHDIMQCVLWYKPFPVSAGLFSRRKKGNHCQNKPECLWPVQTCLEKEAEVLTFRQEFRWPHRSFWTWFWMLCVHFFFLTTHTFNPSLLFFFVFQFCGDQRFWY